jgi:hypothetical protein
MDGNWTIEQNGMQEGQKGMEVLQKRIKASAFTRTLGGME